MYKQYLLKSVMIVFMVVLVFSTYGLKTAQAQDTDELVWGGFHGSIMDTTGLSQKDPREMIVGVIRIALGFLGILALTIIMMAGFKWMLSGGNEDNIAAAKTMMFNGIMGLIIILASLSLANFVVGSILNATQII